VTRSFKDWLAGINAHYGDLMHFEDATTVRNMRKTELEVITRHNKIAGSIEDDAAAAEYMDVFSEEITEAKANVEICDKWLASRGLKP